MRSVTLFFYTMFRLIEKLKTVKDFRNDSGKRHPLWVALLIIILGIMQSCSNDRALASFAQNNQDLLAKYLHLPKKQVPSRSTIRWVLVGLDWSFLLDMFNQWAKEEFEPKSELEWLAIDGKALRSTVINSDDATQNFLMFASLFRQDTALVLSLQYWENKKSSD